MEVEAGWLRGQCEVRKLTNYSGLQFKWCYSWRGEWLPEWDGGFCRAYLFLFSLSFTCSVIRLEEAGSSPWWTGGDRVGGPLRRPWKALHGRHRHRISLRASLLPLRLKKRREVEVELSAFEDIGLGKWGHLYFSASIFLDRKERFPLRKNRWRDYNGLERKVWKAMGKRRRSQWGGWGEPDRSTWLCGEGQCDFSGSLCKMQWQRPMWGKPVQPSALKQ